MTGQNIQVAGAILIGFGAILGLWSAAAFVVGLSQAGTISELLRQYIVAFYNIKGIEYLLWVVFFVGFPVFHAYVNKEEQQVKM
jgi:hypothetical protein